MKFSNKYISANEDDFSFPDEDYFYYKSEDDMTIFPYDVVGRCYICKAECNTDVHHIFQGSNRQAADLYGLIIHVCRVCHRRIHQYPERFAYLKSDAQKCAMVKHQLTIDEWRELFRKDYRE